MLKCSCKVLKYSVLVADSTYFISGDQHIHVKPGVLSWGPFLEAPGNYRAR